MEVLASAALTALDHTEEVRVAWTLKEGNVLPNRHAPSGAPDVFVILSTHARPAGVGES